MKLYFAFFLAVTLHAQVTADGFCRDGVYPTTSVSSTLFPAKVVLWGSYCSQGDKGTGEHGSEPFTAQPALTLFLAGYPGTPNLPIYAENLETGARVLLRPAALPKEHWELTTFALPSAWRGQQARLVAQDSDTRPGGWLGFSQPVWHGFSRLSWMKSFLRIFGAIFLLCLLLLAIRPSGSRRRKTNSTVLAALSLGVTCYFALWMAIMHSRAGLLYVGLLLACCSGAIVWCWKTERQSLHQATRYVRLPLLILSVSATPVVTYEVACGELSIATALSYAIIVAPLAVLLARRWAVLPIALHLGLAAATLYFFSPMAVAPGQPVPDANALFNFAAAFAFVVCGTIVFDPRLPDRTRNLVELIVLPRSRVLSIALAWILGAAATLTFVQHGQPPMPSVERTDLWVNVVYLLAFLISCCIYLIESRRLSRSRAIALTLFVFLFAAIINNLHFSMVDSNSYVPGTPNTQLQSSMNDLVMQGSAAVLPHSYRFLPNAAVRWLQFAGVEFGAARDLYRLIFGLLLFYALYRYARLYVTYQGAIIAMALVTIAFPISFEFYAGQLTDPMTDLAFVLALIFLEIGDFPLLLTTLIVGSLAKETVLAMAGYYVLFRFRERRYLLKAATLCLASIAVYFSVRLLVLHGHIQYSQVSGVTISHVGENWNKYPQWLPVFLLTAGAYLPFLFLGWTRIPAALKRQAFFLLPTLFISGLYFSWLHEARNYMPLVFVLAVAAGSYLVNTDEGQRVADITSEIDDRNFSEAV